MTIIKLYISFLMLMVLMIGASLRADAFKNVSDLVGARPNQLVGYGLVVGLNGSGDGNQAEFTLQSVAAMLRRLGVRVEPRSIKVKNVAAVIVTANIPAFTARGQRLDVTVSSIGDAKSLRGGTLIQTPLRGSDRQVYAVAQGPLSVGGISAGGRGSSKTVNHPTVGRIPQGALVETEIKTTFRQEDAIRFALRRPSFQVATRAVQGINTRLEGSYAKAIDSVNIIVTVPDGYKDNTVELIAAVGMVQVEPEGFSKVVINERTGTVVAGSEVKISPAAIAHGGLSVEISKKDSIVMPDTPFTLGTTARTEDTEVDIKLADGDLHYVPQTSSVADLVHALNTLGVKPADMIVIFQSLASAGAINAEIEVL